jgi:hypothetical protein
MGAGRVGGAPTGQNQSNHLGGGAWARRARAVWRAVGVDGAKGGRLARTAGTVADTEAGEEGDRSGGRPGRRVVAEPPCPARNGRTREESRVAHA